MRLEELTRIELIFPSLPGADGPTILLALADRIAAAGVVDDSRLLYRKLAEREELGSTGIGHGVAIPHCKIPKLTEAVLAIGIAAEAIDFGALDQQPVRLFFVVLSPEGAPAVHLQVLSAISRWVKAGVNLDRLLAHRDPEAILASLASPAEVR